MNVDTKDMTKPVIIKASGKVQGIKGLYQNPSSKRMYIRFSFHGVDRQMTVYPKNMTFSELQRTAAKAMTELKKTVKSQVPDTVSTKPQAISVIEYGIKKLPEEISKHWGCKGTSQKYIAELLKVTAGLSICESKRQTDIAEVDRYNKAKAAEIVMASDLTQCQKFKRYYGIRQCFDTMIQLQLHRGVNPIIEIPRPIYVQGRKTAVLTLEMSARVLVGIRTAKIEKTNRLELELFFRLCVETGQRPKDIYMFDATKISEGHYPFRSHKTRREQRVLHVLSNGALQLISEIIIERNGVAVYEQSWPNKHGTDEVFQSFWSAKFDHISKSINKTIHSVVGEGVSLYAAKHFFITEIFKRTGSEFWAEVFTHEGKNVNQRNYLHPEQAKADEIISALCRDFENEVTRIYAGLDSLTLTASTRDM